MGGEECDLHGQRWTPETLRVHLLALRKADNERVEQRFKEREDAVKAALKANEKRLDGMNEFRDTLKDQGATFITRAEVYGLVVGAAAISAAVGATIGHFFR